jgi:hypothetical protein
MLTQEKHLDLCIELLSGYRKILSKLKDQKSWRKRIMIRLWLQSSFYKDSRELESAVNAYGEWPAHLEVEEIRSKLLALLRDFQKANELKIFTVKIDFKSKLFIFGIPIILLTLFTNKNNIQKNELESFIGLAKNILLVNKDGAFSDITSLLTKAPIITVLGSINAGLLLGAAYNFILEICQIDQCKRFIIRYNQDFNLEKSDDFMNIKNSKSMQEELSNQDFSYLEILRFSVFKELNSNPPSSFLRPNGWQYFFVGIALLFLCFTLTFWGLLVLLLLGPAVLMDNIKVLAPLVLPYLVSFVLGVHYILKCRRCRQEVVREEDALSKISANKIAEFIQIKRSTVSIPGEIFDNYQKLGFQGESLNKLIVKALEKEIQQHQDLAVHEKIGDLNRQLPLKKMLQIQVINLGK